MTIHSNAFVFLDASRTPCTSPDPTTIKQTKINQFAKHVEILEEQHIDKEIEVPVMSQRKVPTAQTVHQEQWRRIRCSLSTQLMTSS